MKLINKPDGAEKVSIDWNFPVISFSDWPFNAGTVNMRDNTWYLDSSGIWCKSVERKYWLDTFTTVLGKLNNGEFFVASEGALNRYLGKGGA